MTQQSAGAGAIGIPRLQLAQVVADGTSATLSLPGLPAGFTSLLVVGSGRCAAANAGANGARVRLNNDAAAHYDFNYGGGSAGAFSGNAVATTTSIQVGAMPGDSSSAGVVGSFQFLLPNYLDAIYFQTLLGSFARADDVGAVGGYVAAVTQGIWKSVAAVNRIDVLLDNGNWKLGSKVTVYGLP